MVTQFSVCADRFRSGFRPILVWIGNFFTGTPITLHFPRPPVRLGRA